MAIETYQTAKGQTLYRATAFSNGKRVRKRGLRPKETPKSGLQRFLLAIIYQKQEDLRTLPPNGWTSTSLLWQPLLITKHA